MLSFKIRLDDDGVKKEKPCYVASGHSISWLSSVLSGLLSEQLSHLVNRSLLITLCQSPLVC